MLGTKRCHIVWWKWKWSNFRGLNSKTPWKSKWKNDAAGLSILLTFHCSNLKWYSFICMAPACLYACLTASGHAPKETKYGVLGYFLPDLDQGITELLDSLRCNLKHNFPEVFYIGFRSGWVWGPFNGISYFHPPGNCLHTTLHNEGEHFCAPEEPASQGAIV